jgi:hypothetical protein
METRTGHPPQFPPRSRPRHHRYMQRSLRLQRQRFSVSYPRASLSVTNSHANTTTVSNTLPTPKFLPRYPATTFGHQRRLMCVVSVKIVNCVKMKRVKDNLRMVSSPPSDTTDKPRSRYAVDFQGQGLAKTGETEALALIDSFTKTVILIPLPDRQASTLVPRLLNELHFRRGSPDVLHSDDAPEFLSDLMTAVAAVTGTRRTSTCGHNPQSNGEIESWWRFWNRAMRYLSPSQYDTWHLYAQRICYAYNSVPHDSIGQLSPFEMDFAFPPNSPFGPPDSALSLCDQVDPRNLNPNALVSPAEFAAALRLSIQAFHTMALAHKSFLAATTEARLNKFGIPKTFALHDRVKIYVPPTHAQILLTGRKSNHIVAWRGPCFITQILSPSSYEMEEECSGRKFQRTIINIRPLLPCNQKPTPTASRSCLRRRPARQHHHRRSRHT